MPELLYFEDYEVGWTSSGGRYVVSEDEIREMGERFDPHPFHSDPEAARTSAFGGLVASGAHVFCIRQRLTHEHTAKPALVAGLGLEEMDLPNPVRPGDRLTLQLECVGLRPSRSRPDRGIVRIRSTLLNQRDEVALAMIGKLLVWRRPARPAK